MLILFVLLVNRFQYILQAATSPATLLNEETQTYLNQGRLISTPTKSIEHMKYCYRAISTKLTMMTLLFSFFSVFTLF